MPIAGIYPLDRFVINNHDYEINNNNAYWLSTCSMPRMVLKPLVQEQPLLSVSTWATEADVLAPPLLIQWWQTFQLTEEERKCTTAGVGHSDNWEKLASAGRELSSAWRDLKIPEKNLHSGDRDTARFCPGEYAILVIALRYLHIGKWTWLAHIFLPGHGWDFPDDSFPSPSLAPSPSYIGTINGCWDQPLDLCISP